MWGVIPPCCFVRRALVVALLLVGCGEHGLLPTTVDPGPDFSVSDVVFNAGFYYCKVEPMLIEQRCGSGDPAQGDASNGCHATTTSFRFTEYMPPVADSCGGGVMPGTLTIPQIAQQNYQGAQARMRRSPDGPPPAPLLARPTGKAQHPRVIFDSMSAEADLIRQWATQYSSQ